MDRKNGEEIVAEILKAINTLIDNKLKKANFDKTFTGKITHKTKNNKHSVEINNKIYKNISARDNRIYKVGEFVDCFAPQGQMTNLVITQLVSGNGGQLDFNKLAETDGNYPKMSVGQALKDSLAREIHTTYAPLSSPQFDGVLALNGNFKQVDSITLVGRNDPNIDIPALRYALETPYIRHVVLLGSFNLNGLDGRFNITKNTLSIMGYGAYITVTSLTNIGNQTSGIFYFNPSASARYQIIGVRFFTGGYGNIANSPYAFYFANNSVLKDIEMTNSRFHLGGDNKNMFIERARLNINNCEFNGSEILTLNSVFRTSLNSNFFKGSWNTFIVPKPIISADSNSRVRLIGNEFEDAGITVLNAESIVSNNIFRQTFSITGGTYTNNFSAAIIKTPNIEL